MQTMCFYLTLKSTFSLSDWCSLNMWLGGSQTRSLSLINPNKLKYTGVIPEKTTQV